MQGTKQLILWLFPLVVIGFIATVIVYLILLPNRREVIEGFGKQDQRMATWLIGDSVLNGSMYTKDETSVCSVVSNGLPSVECFAVDGATVLDVYKQIKFANGEPKNIVLSIGGNDLIEGLSADEVFKRYKLLVGFLLEKYVKVKVYCVSLYYPPALIDNVGLMNRARIFNQLLTKYVGTNIQLQLIDADKIVYLKEDFIYNIELSSDGATKLGDYIINILAK